MDKAETKVSQAVLKDGGRSAGRSSLRFQREFIQPAFAFQDIGVVCENTGLIHAGYRENRGKEIFSTTASLESMEKKERGIFFYR